MQDCLYAFSIWKQGFQFIAHHWPSLDQWDKILKLVAVIVGGAWAWMNYLRGRTFKSRLELSVTGKLRKVEGSLHVTTTVVAKNVGLSKVILEQMGSGITYALYSEDSNSADGVSLKELELTSSIFTEHDWIEPGEPISTEVFAILPVDDSATALRIGVAQLGRSNFWQFFSHRVPAHAQSAEEAARKNTQWSANAVLSIEDEHETKAKEPILKRIADFLRGERNDQ